MDCSFTEAPMNRRLRMKLEELQVSITAIRVMLEMGGKQGRNASALRILAFLAKEERHHVLHLFTRPGLCEENVPKELHGGIDLVDRAAVDVCVTSLFASAAHKELRAYAAEQGYEDAKALAAAYREARKKK